MDACSTPDLISLEEGLTLLLKSINPIVESHTLPLSEALGFVIADNLISPVNVPAFDNSAMDGYAFKHDDDLSKFEIIGTAFAGQPYTEMVPSGKCIRIMTGAALPEGCNTVIMQEHVTVNKTNDKSEGKDSISLNKPQPIGNNVRYAGNDIRCGDIVIERGTRLSPRHTPLLASLGIANVNVFRQPRVAFFSTGDELKALGQPLEFGEIYDSNRYTITSLLEKSYCTPIDLGIINDSPSAIKVAFEKALTQADLIITSGGVSVGDADYTKEVLDEIGEIGFWKLAIKPGKPFAFGKIGETLFCGLPGNPVSALVTFAQLVRPALEKLSNNSTPYQTLQLQATAETPFKKRPGRLDFQRGRLSNQSGQLVVSTTGDQGSGAFSSMAASNCFVVLERERGYVDIGDTVTVELFDNLLS